MVVRRWVPVVAVCLSLSLAPRPAQAWVGALIKAAAKVGSVGAKAGARAGAVGAKAGAKAGAVGAKAGAAGAKAGVALKGASVLGTTVAAERVFLSMADDVGRVGVFVADDGAGALSVVMRGGDEATHSASSLQRLIGDLDEMARVADDAGVDVFVDPSALGRLDTLAPGANTRLFLANTEGPSWPIRAGAVHPEIGVGSRAWLSVDPVARVALDATLKLATSPLTSPVGQVLALDADCAEAAIPSVVGADRLSTAVEAAQPGETVLVLTDAPLPHDQVVVALALTHGIDLVVLGVDDVCVPAAEHAAGAAHPVEALLAQIHEARTLGELWSVGRAEPRVLELIQGSTTQLSLVGDGLVSTHSRVDAMLGEIWSTAAEDLSAAEDPSAAAAGAGEPEDVPAWFVSLVLILPVGLLAAGLGLAWSRRRGASGA